MKKERKAGGSVLGVWVLPCVWVFFFFLKLWLKLLRIDYTFICYDGIKPEIYVKYFLFFFISV